MAIRRPVTICSPRQIPNIDPMFHMYVIVVGVGRSTRDPFMIFTRGFLFRSWFFILYGL